jgi:hypothetical protein
MALANASTAVPLQRVLKTTSNLSLADPSVVLNLIGLHVWSKIEPIDHQAAVTL